MKVHKKLFKEYGPETYDISKDFTKLCEELLNVAPPLVRKASDMSDPETQGPDYVEPNIERGQSPKIPFRSLSCTFGSFQTLSFSGHCFFQVQDKNPVLTFDTTKASFHLKEEDFKIRRIKSMGKRLILTAVIKSAVAEVVIQF